MYIISILGVENRNWLFSSESKHSPKGLQIIKINRIPVEYERKDVAKSILLKCCKKKKMLEIVVRKNPAGYQSCKKVRHRAFCLLLWARACTLCGAARSKHHDWFYMGLVLHKTTHQNTYVFVFDDSLFVGNCAVSVIVAEVLQYLVAVCDCTIPMT